MNNSANNDFSLQWKRLFELGNELYYNAGEIVFQQGIFLDGLYVLKSGWLKSSTFFANGKERLFFIVGPPCLVGDTSFVDGRETPATITAYTAAALIKIPGDILSEELLRNPKLYPLLTLDLAKKMRMIKLQSEMLSFTIPQRLAYFLLNQKTDTCNFTHEELGFQLGTTRPKITITLNAWEKEQIICKGRKSIHILQREKLEAKLLR